MWYTEEKRKETARKRNKILLFPFIAILMVLVIIFFSPIYDVVSVRVGSKDVIMYAVKSEDLFEIHYYDIENDVYVKDIFARDKSNIVLKSMHISDNGKYRPPEDAFPDAIFEVMEDGYFYTGMNIAYLKLDLLMDPEMDYSILFRDKRYRLNELIGEKSAVTLSVQKVSLSKIMEYDPNFN